MCAGQILVMFEHCLLHNISYSDILKIDHLWQFTSLTKLHLDNNIIEKIEGLESLVSLVWLGKYKLFHTNAHPELFMIQKNVISWVDEFCRLLKIITLPNIMHIFLKPKCILYMYDIFKIISFSTDLSFNNIEKIEGLDKLVNLQDLSLFNNRISVIENLDTLLSLQILSIGNNFIPELDSVSQNND